MITMGPNPLRLTSVPPGNLTRLSSGGPGIRRRALKTRACGVKLIILLVFALSSFTGLSQELRGKLFDVSKDEREILIGLKDDEEDWPSDGSLYVYSLNTKRKTEVIRIKNLDYSVQSFFLDSKRILHFSMNSVVTIDRGNLKVLSRIIDLPKDPYIISSRNFEDTFWFTVVDGQMKNVTLYRIGAQDLKAKKLMVRKVEPLATDNFFDFYSIKSAVLFLDNGILTRVDGQKEELISSGVAFNKNLGDFLIASGSNSIIFLDEVSTSVIVYSQGQAAIDTKLKFPKDQFGSVSITRVKSKPGWLVGSLKGSYYVDELGAYKSDNRSVLYYGKTIDVIGSSRSKISIRQR